MAGGMRKPLETSLSITPEALTVFLAFEYAVGVDATVSPVQQITVDCMNGNIKEINSAPVDVRWNRLEFLELRSFLVEWHRNVEKNVEEHGCGQEST